MLRWAGQGIHASRHSTCKGHGGSKRCECQLLLPVPPDCDLSRVSQSEGKLKTQMLVVVQESSGLHGEGQLVAGSFEGSSDCYTESVKSSEMGRRE